MLFWETLYVSKHFMYPNNFMFMTKLRNVLKKTKAFFGVAIEMIDQTTHFS